ncbi:MAG TPA: PD-(D/E)XK nuclease-like domain-containing protein [Bryobacteraceae bacterium]|nr:PD-(D/E)XK nuclease-like domain-containing protein [Bryobacteraceae bacterium]
MTPGIHPNIPIEEYHAAPGISKTGLWTIYTKTPAHFRYGIRAESNATDLGQATHLAVLEPEKFQSQVIRGPADRRGNKWADAQANATNSRRLLLTASDYDKALTIGEAVRANPLLEKILDGTKAKIEHTAVWEDKLTGTLCRCRPDTIREDMNLMLDVKTARDASPRGFQKAIAEYGYHVQEALYTQGWQYAGGKPIDAVIFLVYETEPPFLHALYELPPSAVAEGHAIARHTIDLYAECLKTGTWPGYSQEVTELALPRWAHKLTPAPEGEDEV